MSLSHQSLNNNADYHFNHLNEQTLPELIKNYYFETIKIRIMNKKIAKKDAWMLDSEIQEAVLEAILLGQIDILKLFFDSGFNPTLHLKHIANPTYEKTSLLYIASHVGKKNVIELLVDYKVDPKNSNGICAAVVANHNAIVEYFLSKGANPNGMRMEGPEMGVILRSIPQGMTYLGIAAENNNHSLMALLIDHGAKLETALNWVYAKYIGDGWMSRERDYVSYHRIVQTLMDYAMGVDFSKSAFSRLFGRKNGSGINFLGVSIEGEPVTSQTLTQETIINAHEVLLTLNDYQKLNHPNRKAILEENLEKIIKKRGKWVSEEGIYNVVPLYLAINNIEAVKARLSAGVDPNESLEKFHYGRMETMIPIVEAVMQKQIDVVRLLADQPRIRQDDLMLATLFALLKDMNELAEYLLSKYNINAKNTEGNTLLHQLVQASNANLNVKMVQFLVERKADIHSEDSSNRTPLHYAALNLVPEIVAYLIELGARLDVMDMYGHTPLSYFKENVKDSPRYQWNETFRAYYPQVEQLLLANQSRSPSNKEISELVKQRQSWQNVTKEEDAKKEAVEKKFSDEPTIKLRSS